MVMLHIHLCIESGVYNTGICILLSFTLGLNYPMSILLKILITAYNLVCLHILLRVIFKSPFIFG